MGTDSKVAQDADGPAGDASSLVSESDIFDHIANNPRVFYKNQQIDDPELTVCEKKTILRSVLNESHGTFLYRFGFYMHDEHLRYFEQADQTLAYSPDEKYEIAYHLERIRRLRNGGRAIEIRNRRYAALQQMCDDGTYFTETEMMQRDPLLYEQLVGQFMTEREKQERDARVPTPQSIVGILLKQIDKDLAEKTLQEQKSEERQQQQPEGDNDSQFDRSRPNSPSCLSSQWGNFDEEEQVRLAALRQARHKRAQQKTTPAHLMTAGERELLRDEFIGIMHARFIAGEEEDFDYTQVDDSEKYDDLVKMNQDAEEKYFDKEDDTESNADEQEKKEEEEDGFKMNVEQVDESEDELDVYMRHLNRHLEQQQRTANVSVSVRDPHCEYDSDE